MQDKITITVINDDENTTERKIFMSFGLLNKLSDIVGGPEQVPTLEFSPDIAMQVISSLLIERKPNGDPIKKIETIDDVIMPGISQVEAEKLFDWVKEHLVDFFARRAAATLKLMETGGMQQLKEIQTKMKSSENGLMG